MYQFCLEGGLSKTIFFSYLHWKFIYENFLKWINRPPEGKLSKMIRFSYLHWNFVWPVKMGAFPNRSYSEQKSQLTRNELFEPSHPKNVSILAPNDAYNVTMNTKPLKSFYQGRWSRWTPTERSERTSGSGSPSASSWPGSRRSTWASPTPPFQPPRPGLGSRHPRPFS